MLAMIRRAWGGRTLQVFVVSAVILAVAAIAGASPGGEDESGASYEESSVELATEVTDTTTPAPTPSATVAPSDSLSTTPAPSEEGEENHGTYVSKVAKCVPPGPGHGEAVREMAQTHENEAAKADEICSRYADEQRPEGDDDGGKARDSKERPKKDSKGDSSSSGGRGRSKKS